MDIPSKEIFDKTQDVFFISSNCMDKHRIEYIKQLGSEISIDSRGLCLNNRSVLPENWMNIEPLVFMKYKFYIGFDKSSKYDISDWISDKLSTCLQWFYLGCRFCS